MWVEYAEYGCGVRVASGSRHFRHFSTVDKNWLINQCRTRRTLVELDVSQTHEKTIFQLTKIVKSIRDLIIAMVPFESALPSWAQLLGC